MLERVLAVNVAGAFFCAGEAVKRLLTAHGGRGGAIVAISSRAATLGSPGEYDHYAASKAAVDTLVRGLAKEVARTGVLVNAVLPGYIESEMTAALSEGATRTALAQIPLDRFGRCEDVARMVRFLATEGDYVTGHAFYVDGGLAI